jgi:hypothetical protein
VVKSATSLYAKPLTAMLRSAQILVQIFLSYILQNQFKMITKEPLIETIKQLPPEFSVDEVINKIVLLEKINKGLQQSQKGKVTRDEDLDKKLPEWLV